MPKYLYRFISFEDFINLVINNKDRFMRPSAWDDGYEAYLFSHLDSPEDVRDIVTQMYNEMDLEDYSVVYDYYFRLWHSKNFSYAQSWSEYEETDAMWRCYSHHKKAIRIRTTEEKLLKHAQEIFPSEQHFDVLLREVMYDLDQKTSIHQQVEQMKNSQSPSETYFHKRSVFEHEEEYRLLITDNSQYSHEYFISSSVKPNIEEQIKDLTDKDEIIDIITDAILSIRKSYRTSLNDQALIKDAGNISEFLEGVMVHPQAHDWYVKIIEDICLQKGIPFEGQSQIYKLK